MEIHSHAPYLYDAAYDCTLSSMADVCAESAHLVFLHQVEALGEIEIATKLLEDDSSDQVFHFTNWSSFFRNNSLYATDYTLNPLYGTVSDCGGQ